GHALGGAAASARGRAVRARSDDHERRRRAARARAAEPNAPTPRDRRGDERRAVRARSLRADRRRAARVSSYRLEGCVAAASRGRRDLVGDRIRNQFSARARGAGSGIRARRNAAGSAAAGAYSQFRRALGADRQTAALGRVSLRAGVLPARRRRWAEREVSDQPAISLVRRPRFAGRTPAVDRRHLSLLLADFAVGSERSVETVPRFELSPAPVLLGLRFGATLRWTAALGIRSGLRSRIER